MPRIRCIERASCLRRKAKSFELEVYAHASGSAQRDAVNMLADQLFPNVPKLDGSGNTAQEESK